MNATACYFVSAMADENTEIARGLRRRDPDLLDHLIEKYQHRLLRYLLYLTGRREMAEDFFQETWIRVLASGQPASTAWRMKTLPPRSTFLPPGSLLRLMRRFNASRTNRFLQACSTSQPNTAKVCCFVFRKGCHCKKLLP